MEYFNYCEHPVLQEGDRWYYRNKRDWVCMDVEFDENEELIEEVQNDWLRHARWYLRRLEWCIKHKRERLEGLTVNGKVKAAMYYAEKILAPY